MYVRAGTSDGLVHRRLVGKADPALRSNLCFAKDFRFDRWCEVKYFNEQSVKDHSFLRGSATYLVNQGNILPYH